MITRTVSLIALIIILTTGAAVAQDKPEPNVVKIGDDAPDFSVKTIDGRTFTLSAYEGKLPVLVDIWATWCPPCRMEMPELQKIYEEYAGQIEIVAASVDQEKDLEKIKKFIEDNNITFKIVHDANHDVIMKYYSDSIPYLVAIGKDGKVRKTYTGYDPKLAEDIEKVLELNKPDTADEFVTRGYYLYDRMGKLDKALEDFEKALEIDAGNSRAWCGKGEIHVDKNEYDNGKKHISKAIELDAANTRAWYNMGMLEEKQRNYKKAQQIYQDGLSVNKDDRTLTYFSERLENKLKVVNTPAPDISIETINGETFTLSEYKGKMPVIVDLWATWCGPCRMEMPKLQEFYEKHQGEVEIIAISGEKDGEKIPDFIKDNGFTFKVAYDAERESYSKFPTKGIPFLTIINKDGIIIDTVTGYHEDIIEQLEDLLDL